MLSDFGMATPGMAKVAAPEDLGIALASLRYPLVLKTAEDHAHKSDVGGVILNIADRAQAEVEYRKMAQALGPRALFMEMVSEGTELSLGALWDDNFGPVIVVAAGGVLVELLADSASALAPIGEAAARDLIGTLRISNLLQGVRGQPAADLTDLARQIALFSQMVAGLGDAMREIDVNPLISTGAGVVAVDCLAVAR